MELKGKKYKGEIIEIGSKVNFRVQGALQAGRGKLETRWESGKRWESDEHIIGTPTGIRKARAISMVPAVERWSKDDIQIHGVTAVGQD